MRFTGEKALQEKNGEGGIRTPGSLLDYGALAKRCFRPLSHLTKVKGKYTRKARGGQVSLVDLASPPARTSRFFS